MSLAAIVTGDDSTLPVELRKEQQAFSIATSATVKASIISKNKRVVLIPTVTVLETSAGSVWATSLIVVKFTSAETAAINRLGEALLEIQVDDGGKITWFSPILVVKGTIT